MKLGLSQKILIFFNIWFSAEYPFINYFVIHKTRDEAAAVFTHARAATYDAFSPENTGGLSCGHTYDKYDEVATIARPPIEPISRKPTADTTQKITTSCNIECKNVVICSRQWDAIQYHFGC